MESVENKKMTLYLVMEHRVAPVALEPALREFKLPISRAESKKAFLESASEPGIAVYLPHAHKDPTLIPALMDRGLFIPVIIITKSPSVPYTVAAMKNGAVTVLDLPVDHSDLRQGVADAISEYKMGFHEFQMKSEARARLKMLTTQEVQLLRLLLDGLATKIIARRLNVTMRTIDTRKKKLFKKMRVSSFAALVELIVGADLQM